MIKEQGLCLKRQKESISIKMKLNLTKPLIVFDLETTGLDMSKKSCYTDFLHQGNA